MKKNNKPTFAARARLIEKKYKRAKWDTIEQEAMEAELTALQAEQEQVRESMGLNQPQGQQFGNGGKIYADGGDATNNPLYNHILSSIVMKRDAVSQNLRNKVSSNSEYPVAEQISIRQDTTDKMLEALDEIAQDPQRLEAFYQQLLKNDMISPLEGYTPSNPDIAKSIVDMQQADANIVGNTNIDNVNAIGQAPGMGIPQTDYRENIPSEPRKSWDLIGRGVDAAVGALPEGVQNTLGKVSNAVESVNTIGGVLPGNSGDVTGGLPPLAMGIKGGVGSVLKGAGKYVDKATTLLPRTEQALGAGAKTTQSALGQGTGNLPATINRGTTGLATEASQYAPYWGERISGAIGQGQPAIGQANNLPMTFGKGVSNRMLPDINQTIPFMPQGGARGAIGGAGKALGAGSAETIPTTIQGALGQGVKGGPLARQQFMYPPSGSAAKLPKVSYMPTIGKAQGTEPLPGQASPRIDMNQIPSLDGKFDSSRQQPNLWDATSPRLSDNNSFNPNITSDNLSELTDDELGMEQKQNINPKGVTAINPKQSFWDKNKSYLPYAVSGLANIGGNVASAIISDRNQPKMPTTYAIPEKMNLEPQAEQLRKDASVSKNINMRNARNVGQGAAGMGVMNAGIDRVLGNNLTNLYGKQEQFNVGTANQFNQMNAQNKQRSDMVNTQLQQKALDDKLGYLGEAFSTPAKVMKDIRMDKADKEMRGVMETYYKSIGGRNYATVGSIFTGTDGFKYKVKPDKSIERV